MENAVGSSYNGGVDDEAIVGGNTKAPQNWESPPPPFLTKIYEIVEDSQTNSLISWNSNGTSFIIWDHNKFSAEILPKYFRTTNFSTIVYQLNNYGFRKISCDHYEYKNPWFQSGKKHWLLNIKRKNQQIHVPKKRGRYALVQNSGNATMESKLDAIRNEQCSMKEQIKKLKSSLGNMENQLGNLQTNTNLPEIKDDKMNALLLLKQFLSEKKDQDDGSNSNKEKLNDLQLSTSTAFEAADMVEHSTKELVVSSYADDSGSSPQDQLMNKVTESEGNCAFWNDMLGGEDEGDLAAQHSKAIMVLDEMLASDIAVQRENFTVKEPSDSGLEDDCQLKLWT